MVMVMVVDIVVDVDMVKDVIVVVVVVRERTHPPPARSSPKPNNYKTDILLGDRSLLLASKLSPIHCTFADTTVWNFESVSSIC